jgi:uncharacterized membrane protein
MLTTLLEPAAARGTGFLPAEFTWILLGALLLALVVALDARLPLAPVLQVLTGSLRLFLSLLYLLMIPGYSLSVTLFPGRAALDGLERTGLSLGLSLAWLVLIALLLDRLPWGLQLWPILAGQLLSVFLFSVTALWRRGRLPEHRVYVPARWRPGPWWRAQPQPDRRLYMIGAAALAVAGAAVAWVFVFPPADEYMTEFYILGPDGVAENYPRQAGRGERLGAIVGLSNRERQPATYLVEAWAVDPWTGQEQLLAQAGPFWLERDETLVQPISWTMPWAGEDQQVVFRLYTAGQPRAGVPYRQLLLWLDVSSAAETGYQESGRGTPPGTAYGQAEAGSQR